MKLKLIVTFLVGALAGLVAGCQTYDFEPVIPLAIAQTTQSKSVVAKQPKPNLMFLIDKSGSMNYPSSPSSAACIAAGPSCAATSPTCTAPGCPTRIQDLRAAMITFLTTLPVPAWTGMAIFPTKNGDACAPTVAGDVVVQLNPNPTDLDADLNAAAVLVKDQIVALVPVGGTPTAESLRFMGSYPPLQNPDRQNFVLLLTDGLPNCNVNNPNTCTNGSPVGAACKCTLPACTTSSFCVQGCLDKDNSAAAITELNTKKNIKTIVIGFGAETSSGDGPDSLNAMAEAGGFFRICPKDTDAECGTNNTCNTATHVCNKKFYQATNAMELTATLQEIGKSLLIGDPCIYQLTATPSNKDYLSVIINGKTIPPNDPNGWDYAPVVTPIGVGTITFKGTLCAQVSNATPKDPVKVEFRIVQSL